MKGWERKREGERKKQCHTVCSQPWKAWNTDTKLQLQQPHHQSLGSSRQHSVIIQTCFSTSSGQNTFRLKVIIGSSKKNTSTNSHSKCLHTTNKDKQSPAALLSHPVKSQCLLVLTFHHELHGNFKDYLLMSTSQPSIYPIIQILMISFTVCRIPRHSRRILLCTSDARCAHRNDAVQIIFLVWVTGFKCGTTPCAKKTVQNCFPKNVVKFPPTLTIFGTWIAQRIGLCDVHLFSTSPNSCQRLTVLNADVPNCYITL